MSKLASKVIDLSSYKKRIALFCVYDRINKNGMVTFKINEFFNSLLIDTARNVFCFNENDEILWQIEAISESPYDDILFVSEKLIATSYDGGEVTVDLDSGKLISIKLIK